MRIKSYTAYEGAISRSEISQRCDVTQHVDGSMLTGEIVEAHLAEACLEPVWTGVAPDGK